MPRRSAPLALILIASLACVDRSMGTGPAPHFDSQPPPPPLEATADGSTYEDAPEATALSSAPSTASAGAGRTFRLNSRYFFNKPETHGFIDFTPAQPEGTVTTQSAMVTFTRGKIAGQGLVIVSYPDGVLTIDLVRTTNAFFNASCEQSCAGFTFDAATFTDAQGNTSTVDGSVVVYTQREVIIDG